MTAGPSRPAERRACARAGGFTIVELIVVLVLLGIAMGAMAPRMLSMARRRTEASVNDVVAMFEAAARRQAISGRGSAIEWEAERATLVLTTRGADVKRRTIERDAEFSEDLLSAPVPLNVIEVEELLIDGHTPRSDDAWAVVFDPIGARPEIRLTLRGAAPATADQRWLIVVPRLGSGVQVRRLTDASDGADLRPAGYVDLDALGLGEVAW